MPLHLSPLMDLEPGWIDYNGHLNMAYYGVIFDRGMDILQEDAGFGESYAAESGFTTYAAEFRVRYLREVPPGSRVQTRSRLLDIGPKSFHFAQEMLHEDGWIAATAEGISLHVDRSGPRVAPYPDWIGDRLAAILADHAGTGPVPDWVGAPMQVRR